MIEQQHRDFFLNNVLRVDRSLGITDNEIESIVFPLKDYKIINVLGKGANGLVFKICSTKNSKKFYAAKVNYLSSSKSEKASCNEFILQSLFAKYNIAPKLYNTYVVKCNFKNHNIKLVVSRMELIIGTVENYIEAGLDVKNLFSAFECLLKKKYILEYPFPFLHGDMHTNNIAILSDGKTLAFIDFGWAQMRPPIFQILDSIPLVSGLKLDKNNKSKQELAQHIMGIYEKLFNIKLEYSRYGNHPMDHGYVYTTKKGDMLHSYDWEEDIKIMRYPLPSENQIKKAFPTISPPKVV